MIDKVWFKLIEAIQGMRDEGGQGALEYAILVGVIAAAITFAVTDLGETIKGAISGAVGGI